MKDISALRRSLGLLGRRAPLFTASESDVLGVGDRQAQNTRASRFLGTGRVDAFYADTTSLASLSAHDSHRPPSTPATSPTMRAPLVALALAAFVACASALPTPFASPLTDRAPCRHLARALLQDDPTTATNAASTFNAVRDVVDSVESSFDSVYETVMSWGPSSAPAAGEPEPVDVDEEEGQVENSSSRGSPPDRRRDIPVHDEYYSDYGRGARSGRRGLRLRRGRRRAVGAPRAGAGTVRRVKRVNEPIKRRADHRS